jgi:hypothetical protein
MFSRTGVRWAATAHHPGEPPEDERAVPEATAQGRAAGARRGFRVTNYRHHIAQPFNWTFTRHDLDRVLAQIADHEPHLQLAA